MRRSMIKNRSSFKQPLLNYISDKDDTAVSSEDLHCSGGSEKVDSDGKSEVSTSYTRCFSVVYGKRSTKKHKTWEGDGVLEVGLKSACLKNENGKIIGQINGVKTNLEEGSRISVGNKDVEIIEEIKNAQKRSLDLQENIENENIIIPKKKKKLSDSFTLSVSSPRNSSNLHSHYEELILPRPTDEHQWVFNVDSLPVTTVSVPGHLCRALRPHQREGVIFLYKCISGIRNTKYTGAILADEMGLGKTLQCISLIWTLLNVGPYGNKPLFKRVLIVVPSSLTQNWYNEFIRWIGSHKLKMFVVDKKNRPGDYVKDPRPPIFIISYEMFMRSYDEIKTLKFDLIVCDEGHRLKNSIIKATTALNNLECKRRILLTGTPVQNDLQEFFTLVDLVNRGILGSQTEFKKKFIDPITASREPKASDEIVEIGKTKGEELNRLTSTFILRRTQSVIDQFLPSKNEIVIFCEPTNIQKSIYSAITNHWFEQLEERKRSNESNEHLSLIHNLKKICNHPILVKIGEEKEQDFCESLGEKLQNIIRNSELSSDLSKDSSKLKLVCEMLQSLQQTKERVVLISNFTQTLDLFEEVLTKKGYKYLRFDGSTPSNERMNIVNNFNAASSDVYVLLLSSKAGGVGLNLIGGSRLILYDSDWNPATDLQAMARIWREGQKKTVYIYRLLTSGTIEEKIFQRQLKKTGLSESIVDRSASSNVKLSLEEIKDLFSFTGTDKCLTHSALKCECEGDGRIPIEETSVAVNEREADLMPDSATSIPSLRMNQLFQWEHHKSPINPYVLEELGLINTTEIINFLFKNKTQ